MKKYAMGGRMMRPDRGSIAERRQEIREIPGLRPSPVRPIRDEEPIYKKGGSVKKSKEMAKKEISFMKKKGAPKSMIKHEKAEYGMKKGGSVGGSFRKAADGVASKGKTKGKIIKMRYGGEC
jgi:hypothetical protein